MFTNSLRVRFHHCLLPPVADAANTAALSVVHWKVAECRNKIKIILNICSANLTLNLTATVFANFLALWHAHPTMTYVRAPRSQCSFCSFWATRVLSLVFIRPKAFERILEIFYGPKERPKFTRSAITPPKVNRFEWNLKRCEPNVRGWPWITLGAIRIVATVWERAEILLFSVMRIKHGFAISRRANFTTFE